MDAEEREAFCIVERGQRRLALPVSVVRRVLSGGTLTPLPCAPAHVVGLVSDRGAPLPVVCVDPWIDEPVRGCRSGEPVLVLECGGLRFGVIVDRVGASAGCRRTRPARRIVRADAGGQRRAPGGRRPGVCDRSAALAAAVVAAADAAFAGDGAPRAA
jgi:hypothetical protein